MVHKMFKNKVKKGGTKKNHKNYFFLPYIRFYLFFITYAPSGNYVFTDSFTLENSQKYVCILKLKRTYCLSSFSVRVN